MVRQREIVVVVRRIYLIGGTDHDGFLPGVIFALLQLLLPALVVLVVHQTGGAPKIPPLYGCFVKSENKIEI